MTEKRPIYPIHSDQILANELAEIQMMPDELARELHVPSNRLYHLIAGTRVMSADTALRPEQWLGVEAAFWDDPLVLVSIPTFCSYCAHPPGYCNR